MTISFDQFAAVQVRVGRVQRAEPFPEAHRPAFKLWIDFGNDLGVRRSSAQLTRNYTADDLQDRLVLAVTNFEPKQIGPFMSEVLVLGVPDEAGETVLLQPERDVPLGGLVY